LFDKLAAALGDRFFSCRSARATAFLGILFIRTPSSTSGLGSPLAGR
jgi:hypothetical protein